MLSDAELAALSALVHELRAIRRSLAELVETTAEIAAALFVDELVPDRPGPPAEIVPLPRRDR